jgi:hypothetical protein
LWHDAHELVLVEGEIQWTGTAPCHRDIGAVATAGHGVVNVMMVVAGEGNLLEIVLALGAAGCFTSLLDSGQEQGDKDRDDCDHDEQFDQRESTPSGG